jgi:hypothetical protein
MTAQASGSHHSSLYAFNRMEVHVQDDEGFAVIWRNAQRARGELLGVWCSRLVSRLWKFSNASWFKLGGTPRLASAERRESTQDG